jgi:hypothetical protein
MVTHTDFAWPPHCRLRQPASDPFRRARWSTGFGSRRVAIPGVALSMACFASFSLMTGAFFEWTLVWIVYALFSVMTRTLSLEQRDSRRLRQRTRTRHRCDALRHRPCPSPRAFGGALAD